jgi:predicted DNA binding protein
MTTVVRARVPADEFALSDTLSALPELEVETERIVEGGENVVMPLLWTRNVDSEEFEACCEADPTVDEVTLLGDFDDETLYRMHWIDHVDLLLQMLTNSNATILDAFGHDERWHLRMLYPSRTKLSETKSFCSAHNLTLTIDAIRELDGQPASRYGLTKGQYEALVRAAEGGYFDIPRETTLEDLSDELGVSHQALSERLRRGTGALVEDTLLIGVPDPHEPSQNTT